MISFIEQKQPPTMYFSMAGAAPADVPDGADAPDELDAADAPGIADAARGALARTAAAIIAAATSRASTTLVPPPMLAGIFPSVNSATSFPAPVGAASHGPQIQPGRISTIVMPFLLRHAASAASPFSLLRKYGFSRCIGSGGVDSSPGLPSLLRPIVPPELTCTKQRTAAASAASSSFIVPPMLISSSSASSDPGSKASRKYAAV